MKKLFLLMSVLSLQSLVGCDMFRRLAGRPTARELEQIKKVEMLKRLENSHLERIDSLKRVEKALSDSIAVLDSIRQLHGTILSTSEIGGLFTTKLDFMYYIVVGAFKDRANAESLFTAVRDKGYSPVLINFRNGFNAVGIEPADDLHHIFLSLKKVKTEAFCPDDVWILVNK